MDKNNCFMVAKNVWVDKEGTENRRAYVFDEIGCVEIPIDFKFRGCFGPRGILSHLENIGVDIDYFSKDEAREYYFNECDGRLSDEDSIAVLLSSPMKPLPEGVTEQWSFPPDITVEDFGEADYYDEQH